MPKAFLKEKEIWPPLCIKKDELTLGLERIDEALSLTDEYAN